MMKLGEIGKALIGFAAVSSVVIPIGVDGRLLSSMHMRNPRWLPHAKLHCAMSFFAGGQSWSRRGVFAVSPTGPKLARNGACQLSIYCLLDRFGDFRSVAGHELRI